MRGCVREPVLQTVTERVEEAFGFAEMPVLSFADLYTIVPKNSINAFINTSLGDWLDAHRNLSAVAVVGNCTDLCVHQVAMYLKLYANAHNLKMRVIVPENAVQTYDMPVETANATGALPHDGNSMHLGFVFAHAFPSMLRIATSPEIGSSPWAADIHSPPTSPPVVLSVLRI